MISLKKQWIIFLSVNLGLLLTLLLFPLYEKFIMPLPSNQCISVPMLHLYCPACGGTRAFQSLLQFDLLSSLKYNPIVPVGAVGFAAYEVYMLVFLIKRAERKVFFNRPVFIVTMALWVIYFIIRNLLLFFGVDVVGDIIGLETPSLIEMLWSRLF